MLAIRSPVRPGMTMRGDGDDGWSIGSAMTAKGAGDEVRRTAKWVQKAKPAMAEGAFVRALELIDLTLKYGRLDTPYRGDLLKELCKVRELFCGAYEEADLPLLMWLDKYFGDFALAQRRLAAS